MKRFAFWMLFVSGLFLNPAKGQAAEHRELLFYLAPSGLMAFEFQITVDGKSFLEIWNETLDERFKEIDKNQDGKITGEEHAMLPNTRLLALMDRNQFSSPVVAPPAMDRQAFGDYIEKLGFEPLEVNIQSASGQNMQRVVFVSGLRTDSNEAAKRLFAGLDGDSDGRLSKQEMEHALTLLAKQDLDQDETISASELEPVNYGRYFVNPDGMAGTTSQTPFLRIENRAAQRQAATQLTQKYDTREKDNALSREEISVPETLFGEHDHDGNGKWDFEEIQQYLQSPTVNVTVRIELGKKTKPGQSPISFEHGDDLSSEVKNAIGSLSLARAQMEVSANRRPGVDLRSVLEMQFKSIDRDGNGYWDKEESQRVSNGNALFQELDRDRDEKLFANELLDVALPVAKLMSRQIRLNVNDRGKDLFRILDSSGDSRLSRREFWAMPHRAALWDKDDDGQIALEDIPQQYSLSAERGNFSLFRQPLVVVANPSGMPVNPSSTSGPIWFQRMDRNSDGDVSPREFLGTPKDFQELDTDQDGLISSEEAAKT